MTEARATYGFSGLTDSEVARFRQQYGRNEIETKAPGLLQRLIGLAKDPMLILLIVAAVIYFVSGHADDGLFMIFSIVLVTGISLYQESRSQRALQALRQLTQPTSKVIREGKLTEIPKEQIVVNDVILVEEGGLIPADATILHSSDLTVNESILTGESMPVSKTVSDEKPLLYQGTLITTGMAIAQVQAIGIQTALGKIGKSLQTISEEETPLQRQIENFVKKMAIVGFLIFLVVWALHFINSGDWMSSLLQALTLAMSILPEEIPVAFTTFMALGAWRLSQLGIIVKQTKTVETLGSATVICTDKTGTITQNRMELVNVYVLNTDTFHTPDDPASYDVIRAAMWASEPVPFDPMELALHRAYEKSGDDERRHYALVKEYPLEGKPPMMTHVHENKSGERIIAVKGAPEAILAVTSLPPAQQKAIHAAVQKLAAKGYRVLGVGVAEGSSPLPVTQQEFHFQWKGLVAFYDPPKENMSSVLQAFYRAGIQVKILTGDNAVTTSTIARQIGFLHADKVMEGDTVAALDEDALRTQVKDHYIFTRVFPDAKLKILNALKANGDIVAMTGDGVNDGPALKAAHIGIAMGRGSEIAKDVSSLVLSDDNLERMLDAIAAGRKIYNNLKKAIRYIISIHIPIILTVFIPLLLGWIYPSVFTPVHVIFLELIMGPTCSIVYENEPMEAHIMSRPPRPFTTTFFNMRELSTSILQGVIITVGTLGIYQYAVQTGCSEALTRTMVFNTLISANVFLTLVNRSFYHSVFTTLRYKNNLVPFVLLITITLTMLLIFIRPLAEFFLFEAPTLSQLFISASVGAISVVWFEIWKWGKRKGG
jgi:Ca2+-transporting ATPase